MEIVSKGSNRAFELSIEEAAESTAIVIYDEFTRVGNHVLRWRDTNEYERFIHAMMNNLIAIHKSASSTPSAPTVSSFDDDTFEI